jgi:hypothetical protein
MELSALRQTIEASLRLKHYFKRNVTHAKQTSQEITTELVSLIDKFYDSRFCLISEFVTNTLMENGNAVIYLKHVRQLVVEMNKDVFPQIHLPITVKEVESIGEPDDNEKHFFLYQKYTGAIIQFIKSILDDIRPYYSGPTELNELIEAIQKEQQLKYLETLVTPEDAKEINAKLIFVNETGILDGLEETYKKQIGKVVNRDIARALAFLFNKPESIEYIAGLMPKMRNMNIKDLKNSPFSINSVSTAINAIESARLKPSQRLLKDHERLVLKAESDRERK